MKEGKQAFGIKISLSARPGALFQRQRQALIQNVDLPAIFPLVPFLILSISGRLDRPETLRRDLDSVKTGLGE